MIDVNVTSPFASATWTPRSQLSSSTPSEYIEYRPCASQCQAYTATPSNGASPFAVSVIRRVKESGAPSTGSSAPMLERRSERTMPDSDRTSGPLEPSPG
jgi:hypothetical protein